MSRIWADEWPTLKLGEIADFRNGINFSKDNLGKGIRVVGVADFQDNFYVPYDDLGEINPAGVVREDDLLETGDLVFVRSNGNPDLVGRCLFVGDYPEKITHSGFTIRLRFLSDEALPHFFAHIFRSSIIRSILAQQGSGTNITNLSQKMLSDLLIPLPPLPKQRKIAEILTTWDEAIQLVEALIAALKTRKRGLMQRLLTGEVRFPGFDGAWEEVRLGNHLTESRITGSNGETAKKLTVKLYGKGVQEKQEYRLGSESTQYYVRRSGQFIYSKLDFLNGAFGIVPPDLDGYETTLDLPAFDISETLNPVFLLNYVIREDFYKRQLGLARGGRKARRVPPSEIEGIKLLFPSIDEQTAIATVIHDINNELETIGKYLSALREQKKGLMQRLLTGEVRVRVE